jgi:hypothetical protein
MHEFHFERPDVYKTAVHPRPGHSGTIRSSNGPAVMGLSGV